MITGLKGLAADGHEINCRTCRSGKTCNVANAHGYWVGACVRYSPEKPMTNADKIRAMTDEEMARLITDDWCELINCCHQIDQALYRTCDNNTCEERVLDWLKQEVASDA